jgi:thiosulfate dehydrogenase (quinone) large subunit
MNQVVSSAPGRSTQTADYRHTLDEVRRIPATPAQTSDWRSLGFGLLRIVFGLIWAVDAYFKWLPDFHNNFDDYLNKAAQGQPDAVSAWINFWVNIVGVNPHLFGYFVAAAETAVAVGLLFGILSNLTYVGGLLLSVVIWSTAEGFGGPYQAGSTDIGAAIIYALVFVALFLASAGLYVGLDRGLTPLLGRWGFLASPRPRQRGF